jgi:hypothetical protein
MLERKWAIIVIAGALVAALAVGVLTAPDHRTNWRYVGWKLGWLAYNPEICLEFLKVDSDFQVSLAGRPMEEVAAWFPELKLPSQSNAYQSEYVEHLQAGDFRWIGESPWAIEFESGRLKTFHLLKG